MGRQPLFATFGSFKIRNSETRCNEGFCYLSQGRNVTASLKYRW